MTGGRGYRIISVQGELAKEFKPGEIILFTKNLTKPSVGAYTSRNYYVMLHNGQRKEMETETWDTQVETTCIGLPYGVKLRNEISVLYEPVLETYSHEFVERLMIKYSPWKRPEWTARARRYLDCLLQGISDPSSSDMRAQEFPYLYLQKYGEAKCKMVLRKLGLPRWTNTCENLLHFSDQVNVPLEKIEIHRHGAAWHTTETAYKQFEHVTPLGGCLGAAGRKADVKYGVVRRTKHEEPIPERVP